MEVGGDGEIDEAGVSEVLEDGGVVVGKHVGEGLETLGI